VSHKSTTRRELSSSVLGSIFKNEGSDAVVAWYFTLVTTTLAVNDLCRAPRRPQKFSCYAQDDAHAPKVAILNGEQIKAQAHGMNIGDG